jgi:hypothetical protein
MIDQQEDAPDPGAEDANLYYQDTTRIRQAIASLSVPLADAYDVQLQAAAHHVAPDNYGRYVSILAELFQARRDAPPAVYPDEAPVGWREEVAVRVEAWQATDEFDAIWGDYLIDVERTKLEQRRQWADEAAEIRAYTATLPVRPWADDPRQQSAVRYHMDRPRRTAPPAGGGGGRLRDPFDAFCDLFDKVRRNGDRFTARCPAHEDRSPSLSGQRTGDNRLLLHCHAGCRTEDVVAAVGYRLADLFPAA